MPNFSIDFKEPAVVVLLLLAAGLLIALLLFGLAWIHNRRSKRRGILGERSVANVLRRYGRKHGAYVAHSVYLPLYDGCTEIDHLVFGSFGIAVIETKHVGGIIEGSGTYLTQRIGTKTHSLYHPQKQNQTHIENVEHHLKKAGLSKVPVYGFVVFSNPKVVLKAKAGLRLEQLLPALERLPKGKQDPKVLQNAICSIQVRSPLKKLMHDKAAPKRKSKK